MRLHKHFGDPNAVTSLHLSNSDRKRRTACVGYSRAVRSRSRTANECGRLLVEAKASLPHGQWLPWLADNFEATQQAANAYMRIASNYGTSRDLPPSIDAALRSLASPRQPRQDDPKVRELFPGLNAPAEQTTTAEEVVDATVVLEPPALLDDAQARKWDRALKARDTASRLMQEAASGNLAPLSVAGALRDASHEARKAAVVLEELASAVELAEAQRQREAACDAGADA